MILVRHLVENKINYINDYYNKKSTLKFCCQQMLCRRSGPLCQIFQHFAGNWNGRELSDRIIAVTLRTSRWWSWRSLARALCWLTAASFLKNYFYTFFNFTFTANVQKIVKCLMLLFSKFSKTFVQIIIIFLNLIFMFKLCVHHWAPSARKVDGVQCCINLNL